MSYQINRTNGSIIATVPDGQVDTLSTDLTLIGKNYSGFGEALNENFVKLLENFADVIEPTNPIKGQLWFDSSVAALKVFNGVEFVAVNTATVSSTQPLGLGAGDLWYDDIRKQLFLYNGTQLVLVGPSYSNFQGISGFVTETILDELNQNKVVTYLYNGGTLIGIFTSESFRPKTAIPNFSTQLVAGFNSIIDTDFKFDVTSTNSEKLNGVGSEYYVRTDTPNVLYNELAIQNDQGITIGESGNVSLSIVDNNLYLLNANESKNITVGVRLDNTLENAIEIHTATRKFDLYYEQPDSEVRIGGDLLVNGNLQVGGTTTTINNIEVSVDQKTITLADVDPLPSDLYADGSGIIVRGDTDHEIIWNADTGSWDTTENVNLAFTKYYAIGGYPVLTYDSLGTSITTALGLTNIGTLEELNVGNASGIDITISNNQITVYDGQDLQIAATGNIALTGTSKITGLSDPTEDQDAATKAYVDSEFENKPILLSVDLTDIDDELEQHSLIKNILGVMAPVFDYNENKEAKILWSKISYQDSPAKVTSTRGIKIFRILASQWEYVEDETIPV